MAGGTKKTGAKISLAPALLIIPAAFFMIVVVVIPFLGIFAQALAEGWDVFAASFADPNTSYAIALSTVLTLVALPITAAFGVVAAWALAKFRFPGRGLILAILDLPFTISPIIAGLLFILLYGSYGFFGPLLQSWGIQIIFSPVGVLLTTCFIVMPFVVKELLPTMEELGNEDEEAAITLGASGWKTFWRVTLPNIRWALLYGLTLAAARAAGEFGAASVVSGLIRGKTASLPIQIEILYNEYATTAAFAGATLFVVFSLITLVFKFLLEQRIKRERAQ